VAEQAITLCKKLKRCTKHEITFWLGISVSTAHSVWRYVTSVCSQGLLDTQSEKCIYDTFTDTVIFEAR